MCAREHDDCPPACARGEAVRLARVPGGDAVDCEQTRVGGSLLARAARLHSGGSTIMAGKSGAGSWSMIAGEVSALFTLFLVLSPVALLFLDCFILSPALLFLATGRGGSGLTGTFGQGLGAHTTVHTESPLLEGMAPEHRRAGERRPSHAARKHGCHIFQTSGAGFSPISCRASCACASALAVSRGRLAMARLHLQLLQLPQVVARAPWRMQ